MPVRWIVFRVVNYLVLFCISVQALLVLTTGYYHLGTEKWVVTIIFFSCFVVLIAHGVFNIIWLERFYPNNLPSRNFIRASLILYILSILVTSFFVFIWSVFLFDLFGNDLPGNWTWRPTANFILLFVTAAGGVYILIFRPTLLRLIRYNQRHKFNNFMENNS